MVAVGIAVAAVSALAIPARATYGAQVTADEPQYLLSAISLGEDFDLDIGDELAGDRWRAFHEAQLPDQTKPLADGRRVSPHDPLLPALLALPVLLGGWVGAKLALAAMGGLLAASLVWTAVRRFDVPVWLASAVVLGFGVTAPLTVYGAQVYPEVPAALAVTVALAAVTGALDRRGTLALGAAVVALPWLSVKYAPVAVALAAVGLWRLAALDRGRRALGVCGAWVAAAGAYAVFHRWVYGGWTPYAAGEHFVGGEFTVAGAHPDYGGRSRRLVGLLLDREFGLAAWAPAYLVAVPAIAAAVRVRPRGWEALLVPLAAGWLTATFVAFTMHGWWWPGRQVVVVMPCVVLGVAWWTARVPSARTWLAALTAAGMVMWAWLLVELWAHRLTLVVDFFRTRDLLYRAWSSVLPRYRRVSGATWVLQSCWLVALAVLAAFGWRSIPSSGGSDEDRGDRVRVGARAGGLRER